MSDLVGHAIQDLQDGAFDKFRALIQSEVGIHLRESKRVLVSNRLRRRLVALNLNSYDSYYDLLTRTAEGREEMPHFIDAISTNETYFYRGDNQFDALRMTILPKMLKTRAKLTIWSAACSTGEEAYSILIAAEEAATALRWNGTIEVTATDVNFSVLDVARRGIYDATSLRHLPDSYRSSYLEGRADGRFEVKESLKKKVTFSRHNLLKDDPPKAVADIIFCRNVLMYFARETQEQVINRCFAPTLAPDGFLFIGSSESFVGLDVSFTYSRFSGCQIYSRKQPGSPAR